jgi:hypothetical protein
MRRFWRRACAIRNGTLHTVLYCTESPFRTRRRFACIFATADAAQQTLFKTPVSFETACPHHYTCQCGNAQAGRLLPAAPCRGSGAVVSLPAPAILTAAATTLPPCFCQRSIQPPSSCFPPAFLPLSSRFPPAFLPLPRALPTNHRLAAAARDTKGGGPPRLPSGPAPRLPHTHHRTPQ